MPKAISLVVDALLIILAQSGIAMTVVKIGASIMIFELLLMILYLKNNQEIYEIESKINELDQKIDQNRPRLNYDNENMEDLI
ncbi:MAG: hypothetical protein ACKOCQ_04950 [Candidatus Nitrosotenuis sp.]